MQLLDLESGVAFPMGKGKNWRVVHPDMGARQLTLNHGLHAPGQEFTQHVHDSSEDLIIVLEGGGAIRQGEVYTPIAAGEAIFVPVGEVHGTVNTTAAMARLISFQAPPDPALYAGKRNHAPGDAPAPPPGHRSAVQVLTMAKGGPDLSRPGDWRNVMSAARGAVHLGLDYVQLAAAEALSHAGGTAEEVFVVLAGTPTVQTNGEPRRLTRHDVLFLSPGDELALTATAGPVTLLRGYALQS